MTARYFTAGRCFDLAGPIPAKTPPDLSIILLDREVELHLEGTRR